MALTQSQIAEQKKQAEELLFSGPEHLGFAKSLFFGRFSGFFGWLGRRFGGVRTVLFHTEGEFEKAGDAVEIAASGAVRPHDLFNHDLPLFQEDGDGSADRAGR